MKNRRKKLITVLALIFTVNIFIAAMAQYASADLYKRGSSGSVVREIQTRLKNWGYYSGAVDGIYGSKTEAAVKYFQRKNGLSVDGQVGDKQQQQAQQAPAAPAAPEVRADSRVEMNTCLQGSFPPRQGANRTRVRLPSGRSC